MSKEPTTPKSGSAVGAASPDGDESRYPRRTQRRRKTRATLCDVAARLFSTDGYGSTTLQAIADSADVHVTTLFTHFKSKSELARSLVIDEIEAFRAEAYSAREAQSVFAFIEADVRALADRLKESRHPSQTFWYALSTDDELAFALSEQQRERQSVVAEYVAAEYGLDREKDLRPDMVASLLLSSASLPLKRWAGSPRQFDLEAELTTALRMGEAAARTILDAKL